MKRYLKLYLCFLRFSLGRSFEFRIDFVLSLLMCIAYSLFLIGFYQVLFTQADEIGGWNKNQAFVLIGAYLLVDSLQSMFVARNLEEFPFLVNRGELDYYLVKPVSSLFFVSLRIINPAMFADVVLSSGILTWALYNLEVSFQWWQVLALIVLIFNGVLLYYLIWLLTLMPVFISQSADGLHAIFFSFHRLAERPDRIFSGHFRKLLTIFIPFCLIASFPTRLVVEPFDITILFQTIGVTIAFFSLVLWLWCRAIKLYSSASA